MFNRLLPALGDKATEAETLEEALERWRQILARKACLLIIDDVWQAGALQPLLEGGPRCRRLVTTRYDGVLPQSAQRVVVDAMSEQEAIAMLTQGLPLGLSQTSLQTSLTELAEHLGYWPLLLSVAHGLLATQLRYGRPLLEALEIIRQIYQGQRGVSIQATTATGFRETIDISLKASFRQLQAVVAKHYQPVKRYGELAIFPEDTDIPIAALRLFWQATGGLQPWETDDLCMQLASLSLVVNCDLEAGTIRLHDVTQAYLIERGSSHLPIWQGRFLDAVRQGLGIGRWAEVPSSNMYLWYHLVWHLCKAERWEELQTTLADLGFLARKAWYQGISALEADLLLAKTTMTKYDQDATLAFVSALHRRIVRLSHLLRQVQNPSDMGSVLLSYLGTDPLFAGQRHLLERELPRPFLTAQHSLPDKSSSALLRTLPSHSAGVYGCAVSPNGRWIVSACQDKTLKVWKVTTGKLRFSLYGHSAVVRGCAVSPDGSFLVSSSDDCTLKVWDAATGTEHLSLTGHTASVTCCAMSPNGSFIASTSYDKTLKVWDTQTGRCLLTFPVDGELSGCVFHPDGEHLVACGNWGVYFLQLAM